MIDIHAHILAGIDDGPRSWEDSVKLAEIAVQSGVTSVVATPHYQYGDKLNNHEKVQGKVTYFQNLLKERDIPLQVLPGGEVLVNAYHRETFKSKDFPTLNKTGKYILIEFPMDVIPANFDETIFSFRVMGITPIIAHPERNREIIQEPNALLKIIESGTLTQVNACSLVGKQGWRVMRTAEILVLQNMAHFLASDMHSLLSRSPELAKARRKAELLIGSQAAQRLVHDNPRKVLSGQILTMEKPHKYNRIFGLLGHIKQVLLDKSHG